MTPYFDPPVLLPPLRSRKLTCRSDVIEMQKDDIRKIIEAQESLSIRLAPFANALNTIAESQNVRQLHKTLVGFSF